ncbi:PPP1R12C (predicted), partial [Pycnogonum litorale]
TNAVCFRTFIVWVMESRGTSALVRRAEQLKRWEASETNQEASKNRGKPAKIKFTNGCVFLAACAAGDTDEVKQLLQKGTDIDTANVDGLTALHQACIDDKLDMVEFLVEHGSDVNRGDNEGWTALHATASCGFISIAKYLIDAGANVAAVNYDGDIPIDISQSDEMDELLQKEIDKQGIDCDKARNEEELLMLEDASAWLKNKVIPGNIHDKTGASPLHVAAAKGYVKVMSMLIDAGTNVDIQDYDGWSPIHAAAHWCQRESCELLVENFCDMDIKNFAGQTAFDVADSDILPSLEDLKKKQATLKKDKPTIVPSVKKFEPPPLKRRTSVTRMSVADKSNVVVKDASAERALLMHPENLDEVQSQVRIQDTIEEIEIGNEDENDELVGKINEVNNEQNNILNDLIQQSEKQEKLEHERKKKNEITDKILDVQKNEDNKQSDSSLQKSSQPKDDGSNTIQQLDSNADDVSMPSFRRLRIRNAMPESDKETSKDTSSQSSSVNNRVLTATVTPSQSSTSASPSTANSESFTIVSCATSTSSPIKAWTLPTITNTSLLRSSTYPNICSIRTRLNERNDGLQQPSSLSTTDVDKMSTSPTLITTSLPCNTNNVRRSMVPPVRDDESETQRRAHAKRVRETRRSTQGVTLEDLKSAEQQYL